MIVSKLKKFVDRSRFFMRLRNKYYIPFVVKILLSYYRCIAKKNKKIIVHYIYISKTGGTALKYALVQKKRKPLTTRTHIIFIHDHWFTLSDVRPGEQVFFFVRDPVKRFVSRYYQRKKGNAVDWYKNRWSVIDKYIYETYESVNDFVNALCDNIVPEKFKTFIALTGSYSRWLGTTAHIIQKIEDGTIIFVGQQEYLNEDFERLKLLLSIPEQVTLPPVENIKKSNSIPRAFDTSLSDKSVKYLQSYYAKEYEVMNILRQYNLIRPE
jgi:hypothetical protein